MLQASSAVIQSALTSTHSPLLVKPLPLHCTPTEDVSLGKVLHFLLTKLTSAVGALPLFRPGRFMMSLSCMSPFHKDGFCVLLKFLMLICCRFQIYITHLHTNFQQKNLSFRLMIFILMAVINKTSFANTAFGLPQPHHSYETTDLFSAMI